MLSDRVPILGYKRTNSFFTLLAKQHEMHIKNKPFGEPLGLHRPIPLMKGYFHSHVLSCLEYDMGWFSYAKGV